MVAQVICSWSQALPSAYSERSEPPSDSTVAVASRGRGLPRPGQQRTGAVALGGLSVSRKRPRCAVRADPHAGGKKLEQTAFRGNPCQARQNCPWAPSLWRGASSFRREASWTMARFMR